MIGIEINIKQQRMSLECGVLQLKPKIESLLLSMDKNTSVVLLQLMADKWTKTVCGQDTWSKIKKPSFLTVFTGIHLRNTSSRTKDHLNQKV